MVYQNASKTHVVARGNGKIGYSGKYLIEIRLHRWGYSSVVEHSTADREVPGSNPGVP